MRHPTWRVEVEGLGPIERADVTLRPLTLFVGENNTGKSYLASVIWGLTHSRDALIGFEADDASPRATELRARVLEWWRATEQGQQVLDDHLEFLRSIARDEIEQRRGRFVEEVFRDSRVSLRRMSVEVQGRPPLTLQRQGGHRASISNRVVLLGKSADPEQQRFIARIANSLLEFAQFGDSGDRIRYLPAGRTGLILSLPAIIHDLLDRIGQSEPSGLLFSAPMIDFLQWLALTDERSSDEFGPEIQLLEKALGGRIEGHVAGKLREVRYYPSATTGFLPPHLSSSLVTEVAPIVLQLQEGTAQDFIILEEPEAHLHPRLQRVLARVIVRLIRRGVRILITTHSENFCQQLNNFIKIGAKADRAAAQREFGYDEQDYLELDEVAGYQFLPNEGGTTVSELRKSEHGIAMPTFNYELRDLREETMKLLRVSEEDS